MSLSTVPAERQPETIIIMGVAGCGKTSIGRLLAGHLGCEFLDADDYHPPENVALMRQGIPLNDEQRSPWLARLAGLIDAAMHDRRGIVLACSALKHSYRRRLGVGRTDAGRPVVRLVHLDGDVALLRERLEQRTGHFMPASLLASQCALLERPTEDEEAITVGIAPSPEIIVKNIIAALSCPPRG